MEIAIFKDSQRASLAAAHLLARSIATKNGKAVLGLATGQTPLQTYTELVKLATVGKLSFRDVTTFNLDEYVGLPESNPSSYRSYMRTKFFSQIDIDPSKCHLLNGMAPDSVEECRIYEQKIARVGGIDVQLLGLGLDAHIGFNEPSSSLASRTRLKTLSSSTRATNASYFPSRDAVPHHVLTMGLATVMEARHCVLLAFGIGKSDAVLKMIEGPLGASVPASILQMHPKCTIILDEEAATKLTRKNYYREV
ncbi:MAG: glucosamine-6-phosphate deaminase, partial [Bdellovibrionota bacterium]